MLREVLTVGDRGGTWESVGYVNIEARLDRGMGSSGFARAG